MVQLVGPDLFTWIYLPGFIGLKMDLLEVGLANTLSLVDVKV